MIDMHPLTHALEEAWRTVTMAAVIGDPIAQSLSPAIHNYWCNRAGIEGVYLPIRVSDTQTDFNIALEGLRHSGFAGVNVTMPHKARAFGVGIQTDATSNLIKASNTLTFTQGGIEGANTDGYGFAAALRAQCRKYHSATPSRALILGAGSAASAVGVGLLTAGVKTIIVTNRTCAKAEVLASLLTQQDDQASIRVVQWQDREHIDADLVVNATSLGMRNKPPLSFEFGTVPGTAIAADIVYDPLETPFLRRARARGLHTFNGLHMLVHQAVPGHHRWFGIEQTVDDDLYAHLLRTIEGTAKTGPFVIGLTGSIGMGKTTVAQMALEAGVPVWDADAAVHRLYRKNGRGAGALKAVFPGAVGTTGVDRTKLAALVLGNPKKMRQLEAIIHPLVAVDRALFLREVERQGFARCLLDIPLLFEGDFAASCDQTIVVSADAAVQRERVLARPGMSAAKFEAILAKQMPDAEKRARADHVIRTDSTLAETRAALLCVLEGTKELAKR
ncbi:MAG: shikimate dehydrogenase [Pseudomonadota bacterium]